MKRLLPVLIVMISFSSASAQNLAWAYGFGNNYNDSIQCTAYHNGYIYTAGIFNGTHDFDPGPGVFNIQSYSLGSIDLFVTKMDTLGHLIWAKNTASSYVEIKSINFDSLGNLILGGIYGTMVDLDFSQNAAVLSSGWFNNYFIAKYDTDLNLLWHFEVTATSWVNLNQVAIDNSGNIYTVGTFNGTIDLDPGAGVQEAIDTNYAVFEPGFISKFDSLGNLIWAIPYGAECNTITIDTQNDLIISGEYSGFSYFDFDPGPGTFVLPSYKSFYIAKFNQAGSFLWAKASTQITIGSFIKPSDLITDANGNIYVSGQYGDSVNFDLDTGAAILFSPFVNKAFILKLNSTGDFKWVRDFGSTNLYDINNFPLSINNEGKIISGGYFTQTSDFDSGLGVNLINTGNCSVYIQILDTAGTYFDTKVFGTNSIQRTSLSDVAIDDNNNIYISGKYTTILDADPSANNLFLPDTNVVFFIKLGHDVCANFNLVIDSLSHINCQSQNSYSSATATGGLAPYNYLWNSTPISNDSILITNLSGIYTITCTDQNTCSKSRSVLINAPIVVNGFDLNTNIITTQFRPGQYTQFNIDAFNDGCQPMSGTITLVYDQAILNYENSTVPVDIINNDTLTWNFNSLNYDLPHFMAGVNFYTSTSATINDTACFKIIIKQIINDFDTLNNIKVFCYEIANSYDPNIKSVYPKGACEDGFILPNQLLTYTVQFQNTGNAPALDILIADTISNNLNINTLRILASSHPCVPLIEFNNIVKFQFNGINLPDSAADEINSHGYITYSIQQNNNLPINTVIKNKAGIFFDYNPAIITNTVKNKVVPVIPSCFLSIEEANRNSMIIYPNPSKREASIILSNNSKIDKIVVFDMLGNQMIIKTEAQKIYIDNLPNGIYQLFVIDACGNSYNSKLIKQ
jgi:uncharacterized repeat protein (TIGR01451 family)